MRYLSKLLHLWTPSSTRSTSLSSINLILQTGVSARMNKKKNSFLSLISSPTSLEKPWKVSNLTSLSISMTENGTMRSKTKVLQGRQIRKWSHNLKKSLMNGVTRSKKHLKELTTIKNKTKIVVPKMSWTTGNKEWESSLVFLNNFEARTAEQCMKYLPPLQTILRINLEANQEIKFIWLHLNGEALNWELLRLSMKLKIMLNICRH